MAVPDRPRDVRADPVAYSTISVNWRAPERDGGSPVTGYQIAVAEAASGFGGAPWIDAAPPFAARGLARGAAYVFRVRAANADGFGEPSSDVPAAAVLIPDPAPVRGRQEIPLIDADRQSLTARLDGRDCKLLVWWQPSDESWWCDLEVPANTRAVGGIRLTPDHGILDDLDDVLPGNVVLRGLGGAPVAPRRDAWLERTHALFWEPRDA